MQDDLVAIGEFHKSIPQATAFSDGLLILTSLQLLDDLPKVVTCGLPDGLMVQLAFPLEEVPRSGIMNLNSLHVQFFEELICKQIERDSLAVIAGLNNERCERLSDLLFAKVPKSHALGH